MTYPTVNFQPAGQVIGSQPIGSTSATQNHQLGAILAGVDLTYGTAEFIYLKGVASTAPGDVVCYNSQTGATVRAVHAGATSLGPVAVAMSANGAGQYGWYAISGSIPVNASTVAANAAAYLTSTAGQVDDTIVSGDEIDGLVIQAADSGGFATCQLARPNVSGLGGSSDGQAADATHSGLVTTTTQTFAGAKTFSNNLTCGGFLTSASHRSSGQIFIWGEQANGASSIGATIGSGSTYSTAGAKLLSIATGITGSLVEKASVSKDGAYGSTYSDISGTPGSGTANTVTGRAAIANTASACTVTNSVCKTDATSIVRVQGETTGVGVAELVVTPGNGQFTVTAVNATGAATATTGALVFSWSVQNGA